MLRDIKIKEYKTSNGIGVAIINSSKFKTCGVQVSFDIGFRHLNDTERVMLHILEHLCLEDNENYQDIEPLFSRKGGSIGGTIDSDTTELVFEAHPSLFLKNLEMFFNIINNPLINEETVGRAKNVIIEESKGSMEEMSYYTTIDTYTSFWNDMKYVIEPSYKYFESITVDQIIQFIPKIFQPKNFCILIASNEDKNELYIKSIEKYFSKYSNNNTEFVPKTYSISSSLPMLSVIPLNQTQANLSISFPLNKKPLDKISIQLYLISKILGEEKQDGLLYKIIRKERGLAYVVESEVFRNNYEPILNITSLQSFDRTKEVLTIILHELTKISEIIKNENLLKKSKEDLIHEFKDAFDQSMFWITFLSTDLLNHNKLEKVVENYIEDISSITSADLKKNLNKILPLDKAMVSVIGLFQPYEVNEFKEIMVKQLNVKKVYLVKDTEEYVSQTKKIWNKLRRLVKRS